MHRLVRQQLIPCPLPEVFAFFSDVENLEAITPPFLRFQIVTTSREAIQAGSLIDYRLRLFGVPIKWRTRIELFEPNRRFVDMQLRGPYRVWRHLHEFTPIDGGTMMYDCVDYSIPYGPLGGLAHVLFVRRTLEKIFDYRAEQITRLLAPSHVAV